MESNATSKQIIFGSVSFSIEGIKTIFIELQKIVREQGEIEIAAMVKNGDQSDDEFSKLKEDIRRDVFRIIATVHFEDGSTLHSDNPSAVNIKPSGPFISAIYMSNITPYKSRTGSEPEHSFELFLDFSQPALFDTRHFISSPTPNSTNLQIKGTRSGWRAAIEDIVKKHIEKRRRIREMFHGAFVYDFGLLLIGIPLALYCCYILSTKINSFLNETNIIVISSAYIYVSLLAIWMYRVMFSYTKWAYPLVEIVDQSTKPARHRKIWWSIVIVISGKLFWDAADPYVSLPYIWRQFSGP